MTALKLSRRSFIKAAAVTSAAMGMGGVAGTAFAEEPYTAANSAGEVRRIRSCCRGCGKMECGVWVTVENGRAVKIEGDESAPHTMGSCCNKSVASLQACYHPDSLAYPMKRTQPKGEDPGWVRISWEEALDSIVEGINQVKAKYGGESLFTMGGTGRIWCMSRAISRRRSPPSTTTAGPPRWSGRRYSPSGPPPPRGRTTMRRVVRWWTRPCRRTPSFPLIPALPIWARSPTSTWPCAVAPTPRWRWPCAM